MTEELSGMMDQTATVSAVICAYTFERLPDVVEAVESVKNQQPPLAQIIVVIDHNPPLLAAFRARLADDVIVIGNCFERGLSGARNAGIACASGDLVFFMDDDAVAEPDCVQRLAALCSDPSVIGAGACIQPAFQTEPPRWFPPEFLWVVGCTYVGLHPGPTRNLLGAAMCIRRETFDKIGGFTSSLGRSRSSLPHGCEETEFCIRATRECGGGFVYEPAARVAHKVSAMRRTMTYFIKRCYAEGLSKAQLAAMAGTETSLASERPYVTRTLSRAVVVNLRDTFGRGDLWGLGRAGMVLLGLCVTGAGYAQGRLKSRRPNVAGGLPGRLMSALSAQHLLLSNAAMLTLGTGIASVLGFFYWFLAARSFSPVAVGYAAAAISLMNFIAHLGEVGLGALMMGEARRAGHRSANLVSAGLLTSTLCSALFALLYFIGGATSSAPLGSIGISGGAAVFVAACALGGFTLVLDQSMVGLLRSASQVWRNVTFAVIKLLLLAIAPFVLAATQLNETVIFATWFIGLLASIALLAVTHRSSASAVAGRPDFKDLRPFLRDTLAHHGLNMASLAPGLLLPFLVTVELSPSTNAAFYAAWTLLSVSYLAPASLSSVVYAVGAGNAAELAARLRVSMGIAAAISACVALVCWFGAHMILTLFSPHYAEVATSTLQLLGFSTFLITVKYHYVAVQRVRNRMQTASLLVALGSLLELAGAFFGGRGGDLLALACGWLIGLALEISMMAPVVARALFYQESLAAPDRRKETTVAAAPISVSPLEDRA